MVNVFKILNESKKTLLFVVSILLIIFSVLYLVEKLVYDVEGAVETEAKTQYSFISTEYLGEYLIRKYPDSKAVIIYDSVSTSPVIEKRLSGLRKGLEGKIDIFKEIGLPYKIPEDIPRRLVRSVDYIHADDFNRIMEKYPQANMIISLVGLPRDYAEMDLWKIEDPKKRPKLILFGGNTRKYAPAIQAGFINALVVFRQMDKYVNQLPPKDIEEAFNRRFRLITKEYLEELSIKGQ